MNTTADCTFTIQNYKVKVNGQGPDNAVGLYPIGDIHLDSPNHDASRLTETLAEVRRSKKRRPTLAIFMGDTHDTISTKERKALAVASLHESTIHHLDKVVAKSCDKLADRVDFLGESNLGWIEGNHHWVFQTADPVRGIVPGMTSTQYLAKRTNSRWLGFVSYLRVRIELGEIRVPVDIVACHGVGGGRLAGTTITQVDTLRHIFPEADIYLMGHDHKRGAIPIVSLCVPHAANRDGELALKEHEQWLGRTGSFLRGYVPNEASYVTRKLLPPSSLGSIRFDMYITRRNDKKDTSVKITHTA